MRGKNTESLSRVFSGCHQIMFLVVMVDEGTTNMIRVLNPSVPDLGLS